MTTSTALIPSSQMTKPYHTHRQTSRQTNWSLARLVRVSTELLMAWSDRLHDRAVLLSLDDRMLADIGVTRGQILECARRPFWRA